MYPGLSQQAARYRRLLWVARKTANWLPAHGLYRLMSALSRRISPLRHNHRAFSRFSMRIGLNPVQSALVWNNVLRQQGLFFANTALHGGHPERIEEMILHRDPDWTGLCHETQGALVLTAHHDFHHTLFLLMGREGKKVRVLAAPENTSPLAPWLLSDIHRMHRDCAKHFSGGDYLFLDMSRSAAVRAMARFLQAGEIVFSLHDINAGPMRSRSVQLLGQTYNAPTGALELAGHLGKPAYFAMLIWSWEDHGYHLWARRIQAPPDQWIVAYCAEIEKVVEKYPHAWSGWQWLDSLYS